MALETKAGTIHDAVTATGRASINLPKVPSMTLLFITITGGSATIVLEISDNGVTFIPVVTITGDSAVQFAIPASVLGANITANTGTVTVTYRMVVLDNMPTQTLLVYSATEVNNPITTPDQTVISLSGASRKKLAQAQVADTATTVYTVPAGQQASIKHILLVNPTGNDRIVSLWHDGSADSNLILPPTTILAGGHGIFSGDISMESEDTLVADCDAATAVTLTLYGFEQLVAA